MSKLLIVLGLIALTLMVVTAYTEPPTMDTYDFSELYGYDYGYYQPSPYQPIYEPYNDYFYEVDT